MLGPRRRVQRGGIRLTAGIEDGHDGSRFLDVEPDVECARCARVPFHSFNRWMLDRLVHARLPTI